MLADARSRPSLSSRFHCRRAKEIQEIRAKMHALQAQLSMAQAGRTSPLSGDVGMCRWQIKSVGGQWCNLLDEQNAALSRGMAEGQRVVNLQVT